MQRHSGKGTRTKYTHYRLHSKAKCVFFFTGKVSVPGLPDRLVYLEVIFRGLILRAMYSSGSQGITISLPPALDGRGSNPEPLLFDTHNYSGGVVQGPLHVSTSGEPSAPSKSVNTENRTQSSKKINRTFFSGRESALTQLCTFCLSFFISSLKIRWEMLIN